MVEEEVDRGAGTAGMQSPKIYYLGPPEIPQRIQLLC